MPPAPTSTSSPKDVAVRWFNEVWNNHSAAVIHELLEPDAKGHLEGGVEIIGPDPFVAFHKTLLETLPDLQVEILNASPTATMPLCFGKRAQRVAIPAWEYLQAAKPVSFRGITWLHVVDGKITEGWDCWNQGGLIAALAGEPDTAKL